MGVAVADGVSRAARLPAEPGQPARPDLQYPTTKSEASREIERLLKDKPDSRLERAIEREQGYEITSQVLDATRVREDETTGWGSSAHWGN